MTVQWPTPDRVRVKVPMAPASRWPLLPRESRSAAIVRAREAARVQEGRDGWYRLSWGTQRVRSGWLPGYRKPWTYLEVSGVPEP